MKIWVQVHASPSAGLTLASAGLLQIFDGLPSGQARMVEGKTGHIYEGQWAGGLRHGQVLAKYISVSIRLFCLYHSLWLHIFTRRC